MANYMIQVAYTADAVAALVNKPQNRIEIVCPVIERRGGSLVGAWFAFGEYDVLLIAQKPDNVSAAAFSFAVSPGGATKEIKTTTLMSIGDGIEALKTATGAGLPASCLVRRVLRYTSQIWDKEARASKRVDGSGGADGDDLVSPEHRGARA